mmetsp:Transcript_1789/g.7066  ORF Transcript_1789/g.7066 Transcript_1789/m.7066 type:complete len:218 (-) Transcript_1789:409-1062(-)
MSSISRSTRTSCDALANTSRRSFGAESQRSASEALPQRSQVHAKKRVRASSARRSSPEPPRSPRYEMVISSPGAIGATARRATTPAPSCATWQFGRQLWAQRLAPESSADTLRNAGPGSDKQFTCTLHNISACTMQGSSSNPSSACTKSGAEAAASIRSNAATRTPAWAFRAAQLPSSRATRCPCSASALAAATRDAKSSREASTHSRAPRATKAST